MKPIHNEIHALAAALNRPLRIMEVCGTHTVAIFKHGIRGLLPESVRLLSGPGCPVCVTAVGDVDRALALARMDTVVLATFGDMMRVPGSRESLYEARAEGADVRVVYSPMDALALAAQNPKRKVVFFATGFETTSPLIAATLLEAKNKAMANFAVLSVHKLVPPAIEALLDSPDIMVDGFLLPGHVSTIIGSRPYAFISAKYGKPGVITGFDAEDILVGLYMLLRQLIEKRPRIEIQYAKAVQEEGNPKARALLDECFAHADASWRGIGVIPGSGLCLREAYRDFDASQWVPPVSGEAGEPKGCSCGEILRGIKIPPDCKLFGRVCTPERPVGACMVSSEGSCAAYYRYGTR